MEKYYDWEANYTKAMTEDTYGGKTPEKTLQMFIAALKKEDIDLASKYFMLNTVGKVDQKWIDGLVKTKEAGKLQEVANNLEIAKSEDTSSILNTTWFTVPSVDGSAAHEILFSLNKFSKIWKIESL